MRLIHVSDIHWRGLTRHAEYVRAFTKMFDEIRLMSVDGIIITGDIVHSKTQGISPELIESLTWWFRTMADIAPVYVILGNHDGTLVNRTRQDAITPVIEAINDPRIHLFKKSGVYTFGEMNLCVFSIFDEEGWINVKPQKSGINIALYHGAVKGSATDQGWCLEADQDVETFKSYDFCFLGDIHGSQFLDYRDVEIEIDEDDLHLYPAAEVIR